MMWRSLASSEGRQRLKVGGAGGTPASMCNPMKNDREQRAGTAELIRHATDLLWQSGVLAPPRNTLKPRNWRSEKLGTFANMPVGFPQRGSFPNQSARAPLCSPLHQDGWIRAKVPRVPSLLAQYPAVGKPLSSLW